MIDKSYLVEVLTSKNKAYSTWVVLETDIEKRREAEEIAEHWRELLPSREVRVQEEVRP